MCLKMRSEVYSRKLSQLKQVIVHFGVIFADAPFGLIADYIVETSSDFSTEESDSPCRVSAGSQSEDTDRPSRQPIRGLLSTTAN